MIILTQKLRAVKEALKIWNKEIFGGVHSIVKSAQADLDLIQNEIDSKGFSEELISAEKIAQCQFQKALPLEEDFWRDKARVKWFTQGIGILLTFTS